MLHFGILFKLIGNKLVQTLDINLVPDSWKLIFGGLLVIETPVFELYPRNLADQAKCVWVISGEVLRGTEIMKLHVS